MVSFSQYWLWALLAVAGLFFMIRTGHGWCGMGHSMSHGDSHGGGDEKTPPDQGNLGTVLDPVSHHSVPIGGMAISSVYGGRAYYFESHENRDAFEHDPDKYVASAFSGGQAIGAEGKALERHRHRHGC